MRTIAATVIRKEAAGHAIVKEVCKDLREESEE